MLSHNSRHETVITPVPKKSHRTCVTDLLKKLYENDSTPGFPEYVGKVVGPQETSGSLICASCMSAPKVADQVFHRFNRYTSLKSGERILSLSFIVCEECGYELQEISLK